MGRALPPVDWKVDTKGSGPEDSNLFFHPRGEEPTWKYALTVTTTTSSLIYLYRGPVWGPPVLLHHTPNCLSHNPCAVPACISLRGGGWGMFSYSDWFQADASFAWEKDLRQCSEEHSSATCIFLHCWVSDPHLTVNLSMFTQRINKQVCFLFSECVYSSCLPGGSGWVT